MSSLEFENKVPNGWDIKNLNEIVSLMGGNAFKSIDLSEDGIRWLKIANVGFGQIEWENTDFLPVEFIKKHSKFLLKENDIVMALTRPILGEKLKIAKLKKEDTPALLNQRVAKLIPNQGNSSRYIYYLLSKRSTVIAIENTIAGTDPPNLGFNDLRNIKVLYPQNHDEQQKIATIISTWDKAIELKEKLIEQKKEQKKGLMQKLLTGKQRIPGNVVEWRKSKIGNLIIEVNEKSTVNNQYEVLSVTKDGIRPQNEHFKKQIASENNVGYKIIRKENLVFSTMNLWMGSLDVLTTKKVGIVSPAYKVFEFNREIFLPSFARFFMRSEYMIWLYKMSSEQGASVVRRNLDLKGLLNTYIKIPSKSEQKEIAELLLYAEREINLLEKDLEGIRQQKKGLMQLLLTGKMRVKV